MSLLFAFPVKGSEIIEFIFKTSNQIFVHYFIDWCGIFNNTLNFPVVLCQHVYCKQELYRFDFHLVLVESLTLTLDILGLTLRVSRGSDLDLVYYWKE